MDDSAAPPVQPAPAEREPSATGPLRPGLVLFYLCLLCLVVIAVTLGSFTVGSYRSAIEEAEAEARDVAMFLGDHASRLFEASELVLAEAGSAVEGRDWEAIAASEATWKGLRRLSERFPYIDAIALLDQSGSNRLITTVFPAPRLDSSDRDYYAAHRDASAGLFVGSRLHSRATDRISFTVSRRLDTDGEFHGVAVIMADLKYFHEFYRSLNLRFGPTITLLRDNFSTIVGYPQVEGMHPAPLSAEHRLMLASAQGAPALVNDGEYIHSLHKVTRFPLYLSVAVPVAVVVDDWWRRNWVLMLMGGVALLAVAGLSLAALRHAQAQERVKRELARRVQERTADLEAANSQLEVLFREVHHRVKNNLQVISSMLRLQAAQSGEGALQVGLQQAVHRVHAMSLVHEQLSSAADLARVDVREQIQALVSQLRVSYGISPQIETVVDADGMVLELETAIPLSLIVNEVVSNAFEHAYPAGRAGTIRIRLRRSATGGELSITDDGIGLPPGFRLDNPGSLGLRIVLSLVRKLKGTATLTTRDGLTRFDLAFREIR